MPLLCDIILSRVTIKIIKAHLTGNLKEGNGIILKILKEVKRSKQSREKRK